MKKLLLSTLFVSFCLCVFGQDSVNITFHVNMNNETVSASGVSIAGGSGFGVPGDNPMSDMDGDGVYSITVRQPENFSSHYTFVNGPGWGDKENIAGQPCADPGNFNDRWIQVGVNDTTVSTCFGFCSMDTSCVLPQIDSINVTFHVNMNNETVSAAGLFLAGGGVFGVPGDNPMSDMDGDGVYSITMRIPENLTVDYTFVNGSGWGDKEDISGQPCAVPPFNDRRAVLGMNDTTLSTCFGVCTTDTSCTLMADTVNVTFHVNMKEFTVDPGGVFIAGGSGFGVPGDNQLTDPDGDGVYSITLQRLAGFSSHYTFLNGNCGDWSCKEQIAGQPCSDPNNFDDRFISLSNNDTTVLTCFQECTDDTVCTPLAAPVNVTFRVDMSNVTVDSAGVFLGANFDNWSGGIQMTDADMDNIYEYTAMLTPNADYEWKFINGANWANPEEFDPNTGDSTCTITTGGFTNRYLQLGGADSTLIAYCFDTCSVCTNTSLFPNLDENLFSIQPNQVKDVTSIVFGSSALAVRDLEVMDATGRIVFRTSLAGHEMRYQLSVSHLSQGMYFVTVREGDKMGMKKMIVMD